MRTDVLRHDLSGALARGWAALVAAGNILTAFLTAIVVSLLKGSSSWSDRSLYIGIALIIIIVSAALLARATSIREARFPRHPDIVLKMLRAISIAMSEENTRPTDVGADADAHALAVRNIKLYLRAMEDVLSHAWSELRFGESTDLEVVLMNRASDGHVTVGAWARKRPRSLDRRSENPLFYDRTEAARLYRKYDDEDQRAPIHIIPDVSDDPDYDHFDKDRKIRTSSTILFPIYDTSSKLYGFIAITARNRARLFEESDRSFWNEVWSLWEQHFVRNIRLYESAGGTLSGQAV